MATKKLQIDFVDQAKSWIKCLTTVFVAKVGSFKPRPNLLYVDAQMDGRNIS